MLNLEEPYNCSCGGPLETREYILCECPRYDVFRHRLTKASPQLFLPTLLGTQAGISALSEFLAVSGALSRTGQPAIPPKPPDFDDELIPQLDDDDSDSD